jgi:hypothetical protein
VVGSKKVRSDPDNAAPGEVSEAPERPSPTPAWARVRLDSGVAQSPRDASDTIADTIRNFLNIVSS